MVGRPLYLSTVILLILMAIYSIYIYTYIYQYIVHSKMVLKSLNSFEGGLCKGYLAHFKLSFPAFFASSPSSRLSRGVCVMD